MGRHRDNRNTLAKALTQSLRLESQESQQAQQSELPAGLVPQPATEPQPETETEMDKLLKGMSRAERHLAINRAHRIWVQGEKE